MDGIGINGGACLHAIHSEIGTRTSERSRKLCSDRPGQLVDLTASGTCMRLEGKEVLGTHVGIRAGGRLERLFLAVATAASAAGSCEMEPAV